MRGGCLIRLSDLVINFGVSFVRKNLPFGDTATKRKDGDGFSDDKGFVIDTIIPQYVLYFHLLTRLRRMERVEAVFYIVRHEVQANRISLG